MQDQVKTNDGKWDLLMNVPTGDDEPFDEEIMLCCTDHHRKLVGGLWNSFLERRGVDFDLQWGEGRSIRVHRVVLDVFLSSEKLSQSGGRLTSNEHDSLLEFLYKGRVTVKKKRLSILREVARDTEFQILLDAVELAGRRKVDETTSDGILTSDLAYADEDNHESSDSCVDAADVGMHSDFFNNNIPGVSKPKNDVHNALASVENNDKPTENKKANYPSAKTDRVKIDKLIPKKTCEATKNVSKRIKKGTVIAKKKNLGANNCRRATYKAGSLAKRVVRATQNDDEATIELTESNTETSAVPSHQTRKTRMPRKCVILNRKSAKEVANDDFKDDKLSSDDGESHSSDFDPVEFELDEQQKPTKKRKARENNCPTSKRGRIPRAKGPFKCSECGKEYKKRLDCANHERTHLGLIPYMCDTCGKKFTTSRNLAVHNCTHTGEKRYECDICQRRFALSKTLRQHRRTHTGETPFACDICQRPFAWSRDLRRHRETHSTEKRFRCDDCPKSFSQRKSLVAHRRSHTGEMPFECQLCSKRFAWPQCLKEHAKTHTKEKAFQCDECGKTFSLRPNLATHARGHAGIRRFMCDVVGCGKTFTTLSNRIKHILMHSGEKPFECETCAKKFTSSRSLTEHKRLHSGERPFKCLLCNQASFVANKYLQRHQKLGRCTGVAAAMRGKVESQEPIPPTPPQPAPLDVVTVVPEGWILIPQVIM